MRYSKLIWSRESVLLELQAKPRRWVTAPASHHLTGAHAHDRRYFNVTTRLQDLDYSHFDECTLILLSGIRSYNSFVLKLVDGFRRTVEKTYVSSLRIGNNMSDFLLWYKLVDATRSGSNSIIGIPRDMKERKKERRKIHVPDTDKKHMHSVICIILRDN